MLLDAVVATSGQVASTRSRLAKRAAIASLLRRAMDEGPEDVEIAVHYLGGELRQRRTGVGWAGLSGLPEPAVAPSLTLSEVDAAFARIAALGGPGSAAARSGAVGELFACATAAEQAFLRGLVSGGLRQGALDAVVLDAVAEAADVPQAAVRRAAMLAGAGAPVARAALTGGREALAAIGLRVGRPVRPMLASTAPDVAAALAKLTGDAGARVCADAKLDGVRIQCHRDGGDVAVFTRSLDEITARLPEVVAAVRALPAERLILDGEAMLVGADGRPRPFQETASLAASETPAGAALRPYFFDALHIDGEDLIDLPLAARLDRLDALVPAERRVARVRDATPEAVAAFFARVVEEGQEGVVLKDLAAPYEAGRRGAAWVKVKPRHTLDLVVLAVEWGNGRREGWLSNIHLGARDPEGGGFVMLGKTFKGMTDEMLAWQTERFLALERSRSRHVVRLRPEQVVEIAFDSLQRSRRYPGGLALRFARVLRYRDDKSADEADTIATVRAIAGGAAGSED
ncbi:MAG: ATP-dependent DNA ligase [Thermoleophilia bacterium]